MRVCGGGGGVDFHHFLCDLCAGQHGKVESLGEGAHLMIMPVSSRVLKSNSKSHVDQNDKLKMSLSEETCFAHQVQLRSSVHFSKFVMLGKSRGRCMNFRWKERERKREKSKKEKN